MHCVQFGRLDHGLDLFGSLINLNDARYVVNIGSFGKRNLRPIALPSSLIHKVGRVSKQAHAASVAPASLTARFGLPFGRIGRTGVSPVLPKGTRRVRAEVDT